MSSTPELASEPALSTWHRRHRRSQDILPAVPRNAPIDLSLSARAVSNLPLGLSDCAQTASRACHVTHDVAPAPPVDEHRPRAAATTLSVPSPRCTVACLDCPCMAMDVRVPMHARKVDRGRVAHANRGQTVARPRGARPSGGRLVAEARATCRYAAPESRSHASADPPPLLPSGTGTTCGITGMGRP